MAVIVALLIVQIYYYSIRYRRVPRYTNNSLPERLAQEPPVSVVMVTQEDIEFLEEFMKSITKGTDPLKLYFSGKSSSSEDFDPPQDNENALIGGGVLFVVLLIAVVCIAVTIAGNYIH